MTNGLTTPKATGWPPGQMPRAARGAPPQSDAFAGMLDAHQARTANAEGHNRSPERVAARDRQEPRASDGALRERPSRVDRPKDKFASEPAEKTEAQAAPVEAETAAPAEVAEPVVADAAANGESGQQGEPSAPVVAAPVVVSELPASAAPVVGGAAVTAPAVPVAPPVAAEVAAPVTPGATVPATTVAAEAVVATDPAATPAVPGTDGKPTQPATPSTNASAQAAATPSRTASDGKPGEGQPQPQQQPNLPAAASAVAQQARAAAPAEGGAAAQQAAAPQQPVAASAPVTAPPTAPAVANAPRNGLPQATPVTLARSAEAVENVLRLASARGVTHARIALRPQELGSVDVHLRSTSEGLVARVVAHSPEAVQHLQQAAGDLRRSLEAQGLTLLNLDIGQSGERSAGRSGTDAGGFGNGGGAGNRSGLPGGPTDDTPAETSTLRLPNGVLVDVLA